MIFILILTGVFLILNGVFCLQKFQLYGLLAALIFTVLSIELLADIDGLTLGILTALTLFSLPSKRIKTFDMLGCALIALPCIFWMGTQEFMDGFANSHILVALGVALACNLLFDKQKRQTLCALVLLTSFVVCDLSGAYFSAVDIAFTFLVGIVFTNSYLSSTQKPLNASVNNHTLSIDLITMDSYGTSL
ncbi:MAG: hypothetical protein K2K85_03105 [Clostridia bacterium]|nr:hypothetical protein [Clostridia bacterium]